MGKIVQLKISINNFYNFVDIFFYFEGIFFY